MTVAAKNPLELYAGDGVTTAFAARWRYLSTASLLVEKINAAGVATTLQLGVDYSATAGATDVGGTVTLTTAPTADEFVRIRRVTPQAQQTDYPPSGNFPAESHELALDRQMMIAQEQNEKIADLQNRALQVPFWENGIQLPSAAARAEKALFFDANGDASPISVDDFAAPAEAAATRSELAQAVILNAVPGRFFDNTAAGLAGTSSGSWFATWENERQRIYLNNAGVAEFKSENLTFANFAKPEFALSGLFAHQADFFNPTDDYVRSDFMIRATDSGSHPGKIRFGQFISAHSGGTSPNGPGNAFVGFGLSNIKTNFLTSTSTQETDGLFIQTKTGRFGDTSAILADAVAVNVPGVSTSFANLIEGTASCFNTSGALISRIRFQAANQYQAGTPGFIEGVGCHIIAEMGAQDSGLDISNITGAGSWNYAMRVITDNLVRFQILPNGNIGINSVANASIPLLVNADPSTELAARFYAIDPGAGDGPIVNLFRESASPANNDNLGFLTFDGMDSAGNQTTFAGIRATAVNVANGSEAGGIYGLVSNGGVLMQSFAGFKDSFYISGALYVDGTKVIGPRQTGWAPMTGPTDKSTTYSSSSVTLPQLASRVAAMQAALTSHGQLGA